MWYLQKCRLYLTWKKSNKVAKEELVNNDGNILDRIKISQTLNVCHENPEDYLLLNLNFPDLLCL